MVREVVSLDDADCRRSFGESLPPGLKLIQAQAKLCEGGDGSGPLPSA